MNYRTPSRDLNKSASENAVEINRKLEDLQMKQNFAAALRLLVVVLASVIIIGLTQDYL